jgi:hypothetical protein
MDANFLVKLFDFIKNDCNGDLTADRYQIAFRMQGLGIVMVLKYLNSSPVKELKLKVFP